MITPAAAARIALSLPGVEKRDHRGRPSYRFGGKIVAVLRADAGLMVVKLPRELQAALLEESTDVFGRNAWSAQGWTDVRLKLVTSTRLRLLLNEARAAAATGRPGSPVPPPSRSRTGATGKARSR